MEKIKITTPFIKLDSFLKLSGITNSGGKAKLLIINSKIKVNSDFCLMRGKKLVPGDKVEHQDKVYMVE